MYSVISFGGTQLKVTVGETVKLAKVEGEVGTDLKITEVLLVADGENINIGTPVVADSSVTCEILSQGKDDKIKVFKRKRRKGYRVTAGHRQQFTEVIVKEIISGSAKESAEKKALERSRARAAALKAQKQDSPKQNAAVAEATASAKE